jgi:carboxyl-terminal processing protease
MIFAKTILRNKKKLAILLLLFICTVPKSFSQIPDSVYYNNLYYTCKIWGFTKYFHGNIAKGNIDWDQQLLNTLSRLRTAETNGELSNLMLSLAENAGGTITPARNRPFYPDSLLYNLDLSWFNDPVFNSAIKNKLNEIWSDFRPQPHYLVSSHNAGNPSFDNDYLYFSETYYNKQKGLLGLFRYWNIINYFYPYKNIMDQNWDETLKELIPYFANANNKTEYTKALMRMRNKINDTHASLYNNETINMIGSSRPPIQARFIEDKLVITNVLHEELNLKQGDIIKEINGQSVEYLTDSLTPYLYSSNESVLQHIVSANLMVGNNNSIMELVINDGVSDMDISIQRTLSSSQHFNLVSQDIEKWKIIEYNDLQYGYIHMGLLEVEDMEQMYTELKNTDYWVFDIRNYPNGTLWTLVKYLYRTPIRIANFTIPDIMYPGRLFWIEATIGDASFDIYEKPYAILFDERTQSQAEYTVMGLEKNTSAVKVGSQTSGADGNVSQIYLPYNTTTSATMLGTFYPDYTPTQRIGIVPDIEVKPTIQGIRDGRDEVLEAAMIHLMTTTIDVTFNNINLQIFPNPSRDFINIKSSEKLDGDIKIHDLTGKLILTLNHIDGKSHDISILETGTYLISIRTNNFVCTQKFVKK